MNAFVKPAFVLGMMLGISLQAATTLNDGTTADSLVKLSGVLGSDTATASLSVDTNGFLVASQSGESFPALRNVWYAADHAATGGVYTVSADFRPGDASNERRGGVMGWLNPATGRGISFHVRPGEPDASFQVTTVDFATSETSDYETVANLFNPDGSPATESIGSAWSGLGSYVVTNFATFELAFAAPTAADTNALSNVTTRVTARVFQGTNTPPAQVGETIELLTDLPLPDATTHRVGYFAVWGSLFLFGDGTMGHLDNLTADGQIGVQPNQPPTISITAPASGASFTEPANITIQAGVADSDGTVTNVDFYAGSTLIGSSVSIVSNSVNFAWNNVVAGSYSLTARATDNRGAMATSGPVNVTVTSTGTGPTLTIVRSGANLEIRWSPSGYQLQMSTNLGTNSWSDVPNTLNVTSIVLTNVSSNAFFRLVQGSSPGTPTLSIQPGSGSITITWSPATAGFALEQSDTLSPALWSSGPAGNPVTIPISGGTRFYRLKKP